MFFFKSYHNPQLTVNQQNQGEGVSMITEVSRDMMMAVTYLGFLWQAPTLATGSSAAGFESQEAYSSDQGPKPPAKKRQALPPGKSRGGENNK